MRDVSSRAMKIFIGHAKEDTKIAEAIAAALRAAFPNYFGITMMSKFPLGANWRKLIAESVRSADIMICIATGRLKPSHSFTGMEVGVFEESLVTTKRMTHFNALDRKMIPFVTPKPS